MNIRQEESTPIGDYFHDSGAWSAFNSLESIVDDFDIDTDTVTALCDKVIEAMKGLKARMRKSEIEWLKQKKREELDELMKIDIS